MEYVDKQRGHMLTGTTRISEVTISLPSSIQYFAQHGVDFCCAGNKTLAEVAAALGEPLEALVERFDAELETGESLGFSWAAEPLPAIAHHLVSVYHARLREQIAEIDSLLEKLHSRHAAGHPEIGLLDHVFHILAKHLLSHIAEERASLFPQLESCASHGGAATPPPGVAPAGFIERFRREHGRVASFLRELRRITRDYAPPTDACAVYHSLLGSLRELEDDVRMQLHIENNVLFPRTLTLCNGDCAPFHAGVIAETSSAVSAKDSEGGPPCRTKLPGKLPANTKSAI